MVEESRVVVVISRDELLIAGRISGCVDIPSDRLGRYAVCGSQNGLARALTCTRRRLELDCVVILMLDRIRLVKADRLQTIKPLQ